MASRRGKTAASARGNGIRPCAANGYHWAHLELLCASLRTLAGRDLAPVHWGPGRAARELFHAPAVILSHGLPPDPWLTYGNRAAMALFELTWDQLTTTPSRRTAEAPDHEERQRLLEQVRSRGYVDHYTGVRVSRTGRRFLIERATVWNLIDLRGAYRGQAASFSHWHYL